MRRSGRIAFAMVCLTAFGAEAQDGPAVLFQDGSARDVALSQDGATIYVALYASDEIVAIDSLSGTIRGRAKVGDGPAAVATNDGSIGVLNRTDGSVSILDPVTLEVRATVDLIQGTCALFQAGPALFGTINPYSGEVSLVESGVGMVARSAAFTNALPVAGAYDGGRIAIVGRDPASIWLLDTDTLAVVAQQPLDAAPRAIVPAGTGRFAVETADSVVMIDAQTLAPIRTLQIKSSALTSSPHGLLCVAGPYVWSLTPELELGESWALPDRARGARWAGSSIVAWAPSLGRVWRLDAQPMQMAAAASAQDAGVVVPGAIQAERTVAPASPTPVVVAQESPTSDETPPREGVTGPSEPATTETPEEPHEAAPEPAATPAAPAPEYRLTVRPRNLGLAGIAPYAPRFGDPTGRTFDDELVRALDTAADSDSLTNIEFRKLENIKFTQALERTGSGDDIRDHWRGGLEFDVDRVHVKTDELIRTTKPPELILDGDVSLVRGESSLTADRIRAFSVVPPSFPGIPRLVPAAQAKPVPHPLVPHGYQEPEPDRHPPLGIVEMDQMVWVEPERRLEADVLRANSLTRTADITSARGQVGPLYFGSKHLQVLGPDRAVGQDFWITTCDLPVPHYRLRLSRAETEDGESVVATNARLQLGAADTPFYVPKLRASLVPGERRLATEINLGRRSEVGNFLNLAQWFRVTDNVEVAPRIYATSLRGTGLGFDAEYDFMNDPASAMYRSRGQIQTLRTTENNGYTQWYHRQEFTPDTVMLGQWEQWYQEDFVKDFYNEEYEDRTGPRSFMSIAHTRPEYLATATVAKATHDFTTETEKLPELTFHMFERRLAGGFYGSFDSAAGYYETQPDTVQAARGVTLGRLSYDWNITRGFNLLPFLELEGTYYTKTLDDEQDASRGSATVGITAQTRLQRSFAGLGHFTGFKHLIIPSATLSFRPDSTLDAEDTPRFDDFDDRPGRFRIESTIDNILLGRNGPTGEIWPVMRMTLYQGNDLENEAVRSNDYEIELEVRPRPAWGLQAVGEMHDLDEDSELPGDDFDRVLTYLFYDNLLGKNNLNGRMGFAYTESGPDIVNQEILYGMGYRLSGKWSMAFEQRYDFERNELVRQTYSVRRKLHDWEVAFTFREKDSGIDVGIEINLIDFPEIRLGM